MNNRKSYRANQYALKYLILTSVMLIVAVPFYWMLITSLKHPSKVFAYPQQWFPHPIHWQNFVSVFEYQPFHLFFFNSTYIAVVTTLGTCFFASLAGYATAKINFPFRNALFLILLSSMMIPTEATAIPLFIWMSGLGLVNTHFPLIVPPMLGAGGMFGVFLFRQFFMTVPTELVEAAKLDGCSPWKTYWNIMIPLTKPVMATLVIFTFLRSWDELFEPLIFLSSAKLFTLPLGLGMFTTHTGTEWHLLMAASVMTTAPLLIVFFFAQKRFIDGVALTGLK